MPNNWSISRCCKGCHILRVRKEDCPRQRQQTHIFRKGPESSREIWGASTSAPCCSRGLYFAKSWCVPGGSRAACTAEVESHSVRDSGRGLWVFASELKLDQPNLQPSPEAHSLDEIPSLAPQNVSHAAHIWKLAFYVAHLEKNEAFLGTQVAIIKSQPRKHGQYLTFARRQEPSY